MEKIDTDYKQRTWNIWETFQLLIWILLKSTLCKLIAVLEEQLENSKYMMQSTPFDFYQQIHV